jgi:hypothetical protein
VPTLRFVSVPRVGSGEERVNQFLEKAIKALLDPLTAKEQETGLYNPPPKPRIAFEGTLDDAQVFYQKTTPVANCKNCPIAVWTDGLPVIIPTEDKVKEILTGTSHKPGEYIAYSTNGTVSLSSTGIRINVKKGDPMLFMPTQLTATVEKIAINAVMAGCKPEYLPVVLAIASSGGMAVTSNNMWSYLGCVSGPYAQEIGMNAGQGAMNPGNPANATIGRAWILIQTNIGGALQGVTRIETPGSPFNLGGTMFAEDYAQNPSGWLSLREEYTHTVDGKAVNYSKNDSIVMLTVFHGAMHTTQFAPSSFRALNSGEGGIAARLGVPKGQAGKYNFLEYIIEELVQASECRGWGGMFLMHPSMAQSLKEYGFATKMDAYNWISKAGMRDEAFHRKTGWWDFSTAGGENTVMVDGKAVKYKDLPDNYPYATLGPASNLTIIVGISPGDETCVVFGSGRGSAYWIDPWK